jgi:hypothetical protein
LTTTCPDAIAQLTVPPECYDDEDNSMAFAVLPFAAPNAIKDVMVPSQRDDERNGFAERLDELSTMVNLLRLKQNLLREHCVENGLLDKNIDIRL